MVLCPFCHTRTQPEIQKRMSVAGIICLLAGFCLTPFVIGLALIPIAFFLKEEHHVCSACHVRLD